MERLLKFIALVAFLAIAFDMGAYQKEAKPASRLLDRLLKIQPPQGAIELEIIHSFPTKEQEESGHYLWGPDAIQMDSFRNIYITDYKANSVLKYDLSGNFIMNFGQIGQGPGDLSMPMMMKIINDTIIINEARNRRLQFFNLEGKSQKTIPLFKSYYSFDIAKDGYFYGQPLFYDHTKEKLLIEVLSPEGKRIRSFGVPLKFKWDSYILNESFLFINKKDEILQVFARFPIIRKYSRQGQLIAEHRLEGEIFNEKEKYNRKIHSYRPGGRAAYTRVFKCGEIMDNSLFLVDFIPPRLWIREVDDNGKIVKTYWAYVSEEVFVAKAIMPVKDKNQIKFFIPNSVGDAKIYIFATNRATLSR